jgi:hypothetical protein
MIETEEGSLREILGSAGWQVIRQRLEYRLDQLRFRILKGSWVTLEDLRELSRLQGEEAFLDALLEDPRKVLEACQPREQAEGAATRPGVGQFVVRKRSIAELMRNH